MHNIGKGLSAKPCVRCVVQPPIAAHACRAICIYTRQVRQPRRKHDSMANGCINHNITAMDNNHELQPRTARTCCQILPECRACRTVPIIVPRFDWLQTHGPLLMQVRLSTLKWTIAQLLPCMPKRLLHCSECMHAGQARIKGSAHVSCSTAQCALEHTRCKMRLVMYPWVTSGSKCRHAYSIASVSLRVSSKATDSEINEITPLFDVRAMSSVLVCANSRTAGRWLARAQGRLDTYLCVSKESKQVNP